MTALIRRDRPMSILYNGKDMYDVVKVITGMRRVGKSTLLKMYAEELITAGTSPNDIISINLESIDYLNVRDCDSLNSLIFGMIGESGTKYVFIDEIQNVDGWELTISALIITGRCDIYVTGSNSSMLSSELATHISGRYIEIHVLPLSFKEYLELHPGDRNERFNQFLRYGALPEVDPSRGKDLCDAQLTGIYNTVLVKDVLARTDRGDVTTLDAIIRFLYSNIGNVTNVDSISKTLNASNEKVRRCIKMMEDAFLIYHAERFDIIGKKLLKTNGKYYATDMGLRFSSLRGAAGTDISRPLENIVFLELIRRGYTVHVGSYRDREVDFTAFKNGKTEYYQVCQTVLSEDTRTRESRSLNDISDNYPKTILTLDVFGLGSENGIEIVNVLDWLTTERRKCAGPDKTPHLDQRFSCLSSPRVATRSA